jgi:uncharacterized membrane protein
LNKKLFKLLRFENQELNTPAITVANYATVHHPAKKIKIKRIESIDLLRGVVMIIMAIDHVRDYFHYDAFFYSPTDLSQTSPLLFFTRFITHYCAPVFVFLAGTSAYLSGAKKSRNELAFFLLTRGIWLVLVELFILSLFRTFNPSYPYLNLQVIWAIGICMIALSGIIYLKRIYILLIGILLVGAHNLLDTIHVPGNSIASFLWAVLHEPNRFEVGDLSVSVNYPVLPWIGIMALGFCCGSLYANGYNEKRRRRLLLSMDLGAIILFIVLRIGNSYGDAALWSHQKNGLYSLLSFINVTKYPPSLLYTLITLGPSLIFLSVSEKPLKALGEKIAVFGRVPMFYYLAHILLIHILAAIAALITGYPDMIVLSNRVFDTPGLKGYGFNLATVYIVWIGLIFLLYPFCKWFDRYKRAHHAKYWWLSYL